MYAFYVRVNKNLDCVVKGLILRLQTGVSLNRDIFGRGV